MSSGDHVPGAFHKKQSTLSLFFICEWRVPVMKTEQVIIIAPPSPPSIEIVSTTSSTIHLQWKVDANKLTKVKGISPKSY